MASNQPKRLGVEIHLPNGEVKRFKQPEIAAYGMTPAGVVVAVKHGEKFTRYCNFPTVFHEELSAILVADASEIPV